MMLIYEQVIIPVVVSADLIAGGDQLGWSDLSSPTIPATWGHAIEVPLSKAKPSYASMFLGIIAAKTFTPGAATSGYKTSI